MGIWGAPVPLRVSVPWKAGTMPDNPNEPIRIPKWQWGLWGGILSLAALTAGGGITFANSVSNDITAINTKMDGWTEIKASVKEMESVTALVGSHADRIAYIEEEQKRRTGAVHSVDDLKDELKALRSVMSDLRDSVVRLEERIGQ